MMDHLNFPFHLISLSCRRWYQSEIVDTAIAWSLLTQSEHKLMGKCTLAWKSKCCCERSPAGLRTPVVPCVVREESMLLTAPAMPGQTDRQRFQWSMLIQALCGIYVCKAARCRAYEVQSECLWGILDFVECVGGVYYFVALTRSTLIYFQWYQNSIPLSLENWKEKTHPRGNVEKRGLCFVLAQ